MNHKPRLVVIEDCVPDVSMIEVALKEEGVDYDLTTIDDGEQALSYARAEGEYEGALVPDLILLDMNLPKVDGPTILRAVRGQARLAKVPIIVWSSVQAPRDKSVDEFRIHRFITKPAGLTEFLKLGSVIREALMLRRSASG
jgi:two-component system, chemotaxis family, response regulator Rcp1